MNDAADVTGGLIDSAVGSATDATNDLMNSIGLSYAVPAQCDFDCANVCVIFSCDAGLEACLNNCGCQFTDGNPITAIEWQLSEEDSEAWDILLNGTCLLNCGI